MRHGISLLEVLISMFVLTVGLLGLASMVPVGQFQVREASHADAATSIGRREAFKHIKVLDMLDHQTWAANTASNTYTAYTASAPYPFVIDGLAVSGHDGAGSATFNAAFQRFPYVGNNFLGSPLRTLDRISLLDLPKYKQQIAGGDSIPVAMTNSVHSADTADRIFRGIDDKIYQLPTDVTQRPSLVSSGQSVQLQSSGDFSWMVMVAPALWYDTDQSPDKEKFIDGLGTTTVIVFYKRDLTDSATPKSERVVWGDVQVSGGGALDLQLREEPTAASTTLEDAKKVFKVRHNQWIMVAAQLPAAGDAPAIPRYRWYRVVTVGEVELRDPTQAFNASSTPPNTYICDVTLAGPDINDADYSDADSVAANGKTFVATICDGVIGVFEKTVQLDEPSLWTAH